MLSIPRRRATGGSLSEPLSDSDDEEDEDDEAAARLLRFLLRFLGAMGFPGGILCEII